MAYELQVSIPSNRKRAEEFYRTCPLFNAMVDEWSDATGYGVSTILGRGAGWQFAVPPTLLLGWESIDYEMLREVIEDLPLYLREVEKDPERLYTEYHEEYYPEETEEGRQSEAYGTAHLDEIYARVCELKNLIEQQREMMEGRA